jgi:hypothetical protein
MTCAEFALLAEQYRGQQEREDRRAALAAFLHVFHPGSRQGEVGDPLSLEELVSFLGHGFQRRAQSPAAPPPEELAQRLEVLHSFYGGNGQTD